ncbi:agouti-signaling protein 2b [Mastacembelus armatus]|uniref:Agouti signaling protein, nonagouti homolog (mouse) 2b n=1 Tax=Mastacembelus armatus TaxID=205130 RepID=A0A3Q3KSF3_9TELE|nr:agouti-related protein-like [Mastacembelus armatus]
MRKISGKHLCFLLLLLSLSWAENVKRNVGDNDTDIGWSRVKTRQLFSKQKISPPQESNIPKRKSSHISSARRCSRVTESCFSHLPCCDPCTSCRCRLFNTICHCWRMNTRCLKKT